MTAALIIAAGAAPGVPPIDPMRQVGDMTAVRRQILVFQQMGIDRVVLVGGHDAESLKKHVARMGVTCLAGPPDDTQGLLAYAKVGLDYLQDKCSKALMAPASVPLFLTETARQAAQAEGALAIPCHEGRRGWPVALAARLFGQVLAYDGDGDLPGALEALDAEAIVLNVADAGAVCDVGLDAGCEALVQAHSLNVMQPVLKVLVARGDFLYGPGPQQLLRLVEDSHSLRLACQRMGISYSKGWKMIKGLERMFGYAIVARQQGGKHGGGSEITPQGLELMRNYEAFVKEMNEQGERVFHKYFG